MIPGILDQYIEFLNSTGMMAPVIAIIWVPVSLQIMRFLIKALSQDEYQERPDHSPYIIPPTSDAEIAVVESADEDIADAPQEARCEYCGTKQTGNICTQCGAPV